MKNKKPENIVEGAVFGIEDGLERMLEAGIKFSIRKIKEALKKKEVNEVLDSSYLKNKEQWYHRDALAYSLKNNVCIGFGHIDLNRHTVVCATTGGGKNVLCDNLIESRLKAGLPVVMIDPKGDHKALLRFQALNKKYNRTCYVFSESQPLSDRCNPVLEGTPSAIIDRLYKIFDWGEPYYADTNYIALEKAVHGLRNEKRPVTIKALHEYLDTNLKDKETINIINKLGKINNSAFGHILTGGEDDASAVTFSKLREERASIYIGLSTLGFPEVSQAIGKLFIYELMYHSYQTFIDYSKEDAKAPAPFSVFIDELGSVITPDFISLINKCRGAGIGVCVSFQLLSDLDSVSAEFRDRLIGNMNNFFIGHCHVPDEAEYWSKMIGTTESKKFTYMTEEDEEQSRGSVRESNEFLVHPDIFKKLEIGQFVVKTFFPKSSLDLVKVRLKTRKELEAFSGRPQKEI